MTTQETIDFLTMLLKEEEGKMRLLKTLHEEAENEREKRLLKHNVDMKQNTLDTLKRSIKAYKEIL